MITFCCIMSSNLRAASVFRFANREFNEFEIHLIGTELSDNGTGNVRKAGLS